MDRVLMRWPCDRIDSNLRCRGKCSIMCDEMQLEGFDKAALRREMKTLRKGLSADAKASADAAICEKLNARRDIGGLAGPSGGLAMGV